MTSDPDDLAFRDVLFEALAGVENAIGDASPMDILRRVTVAAFRSAPDQAAALTPLNEIAAMGTLESAIAVARGRYIESDEFSEAVYFARCLGRDPGTTVALAAARMYLDGSSLPDERHYKELRSDRLSIYELATFERGWKDEARLAGSLNLIRPWRVEYAREYEKGHAEFRTAVSSVFEQVEAQGTAAAALERLNELRRLGPALALSALQSYRELERLFPCGISETALAASLTSSPVCPECGFKLGDTTPTSAAKQVLSAIQRGLSMQQQRLSRRVIGRLLARPAVEPQTKLQRFLEVVQASDLAGLALVIDDEIVAFLDELMAEGNQERGVLGRLVIAYPTVSSTNLEAAVEEFRRLLTDETARDGIVRLRAPAEDRPMR